MAFPVSIVCMADKKRHIEQLFKEHYQAMFRLAVMLLHDEEDARDVVHDIFAKLLDGDIRFDEEKSRAFLLSCVRNSCLNLMRSRNRKEQALRSYLLDEEDLHEEFEAEIIALRDDIKRLAPPICQEILLLHYREGLTFKVIAQRLNVSEKTIYKHLRNAINQLRLTLNEIG